MIILPVVQLFHPGESVKAPSDDVSVSGPDQENAPEYAILLAVSFSA